MERTILTPRLKLTLVEKAERGSQELAWLHAIRSDEKTTWWSIHGTSKNLEDTEKHIMTILPAPATDTPDPEPKAIRIVYAIHEILPNGSANATDDVPTRFIGIMTLKSLFPTTLPEADHLFPPSTRSPTSVLTMELGYLFLPVAWSRGFATESVKAVLGACKSAPKEMWFPWEKVFVQAIVDKENAGSRRVMEKSEMRALGDYRWEGNEVWMSGRWRGWMELMFWGMWIVE
ncbi:GNAT family acetyltransferase-like protein [Phaeosphaeria sp. MPI-PUGE-AT-0046c]|nr:GNAT family acetyltransferase-like protein [Phaeosphaeria sp. MPI-PUGE-AT-0046c]